ncbi:addiction module antidote protein, HigA family [Sandarakinorhabdus cyanobacteriorum]|uniref:Addiction module antidote protein, HigA family n=2 Tax=Sandarakinorhabdus cyanobacteriorum TaxID=1981098 RepID=A0A255YTB3_9SPHN|nr:addiction module antidote protein, HigA family [Sandarakinorhabdus cyanobacteriorum]
MCASKTIIEAELLPPVHPGEFLREEFGIGSAVTLVQVADAAGIDLEKLAAILAEQADFDGDTDLRLARFFGVSEGLFLGLQHQFELDIARRAAGAALDAIIPLQTAAE